MMLVYQHVNRKRLGEHVHAADQEREVEGPRVSDAVQVLDQSVKPTWPGQTKDQSERLPASIHRISKDHGTDCDKDAKDIATVQENAGQLAQVQAEVKTSQ